MIKFQNFPRRWVFRNNDGEWHIMKEVVKGAGPGYIAQYFPYRYGNPLVDDCHKPGVVINEPHNGGLGCVGWHNARRNGEPEIVNRTWDVSGRIEGPFGVCNVVVVNEPFLSAGKVFFSVIVDISDGNSFPNPIMRVRYDYVFEEDCVSCWVTLTSMWDGSGPALFIKEPKIVCSLLGMDRPNQFQIEEMKVLARDGSLLGTYDLNKLTTDPSKHTIQLRQKDRARLWFHNYYNKDLISPFNIVMLASDYGRKKQWMSDAGFDLWAQRSNHREAFENDGAAYCTQGVGGTLTRNWEVARGPGGAVGAMFHAWEGGFGYPDCLKCYRAWPERGEQYQIYSCYSLGEGWRI